MDKENQVPNIDIGPTSRSGLSRVTEKSERYYQNDSKSIDDYSEVSGRSGQKQTELDSIYGMNFES